MFSDFSEEEKIIEEPLLNSLKQEEIQFEEIPRPLEQIEVSKSTKCPAKCQSCSCDETIKKLFSNDTEDRIGSCCEGGNCNATNCIGAKIHNMTTFKLVLKDVNTLLSTFNETSQDILDFIKKIEGVKVAMFEKNNKNYLNVHGTVSVLKVFTETKKRFKSCAFVRFLSQRIVIFDVLNMKCNNCVQNIEKEISKIEDVSAVSCNLDEKRCYIFTYADTKILKQEFKKIGKDVQEVEAPKPQKTLEFDVQGMKCNGCASKIIKNVMEIPGVLDVKVNLEKKRVNVDLDSKNLSSGEIEEKIKILGYKVQNLTKEEEEICPIPDEDEKIRLKEVLITSPKENIKKTIVKIEEMSCSSCISKIESRLMKQPGVLSVSINLLLKKGEIIFNSSLNSETELIEMINKLGFPSKKITEYDTKGSITFVLEPQIFDMNISDIENILITTDGIVHIDPNTEKKTIDIKFDENIIKKRQIFNKIEKFRPLVYNHKQEMKETIMRDEEKKKWMRLFIISSIFTIPVLIIDMILGKIPFVNHYLMMRVIPSVNLSIMNLLMVLLVTPVHFICGFPFYKLAFNAIRNFSADMNVLITIGTWEAYLYSLFAIIYMIFDPNFEGDQFMETSAALIMFLSLGRWLESIAKAKTSQALIMLMDLQPSHAKLVEIDSKGVSIETEIQVELIQKHDILKLVPGDKVPCDGVIVSGNSSISESMITGEYIPVSKQPGDKVIGGTINIDGLLFIRSTFVGEESTLSNIAKMVEEAQTKKPNIQKLADKISGYFVYGIIFISLFVFTLWMILSYSGAYPANWRPQNMNGFVFSLILSVSTVVVACPCALGLATPTAIMVGTGVAASNGILIKGGEVLETAKNATSVLFDKTGTLTIGSLIVNSIVFIDEKYPLSEFYMLLGSIETSSSHPIAKAIVTYCKQKTSLAFQELNNLESIPGRGMKCDIDKYKVIVGNEEYMKNEKINLGQSEDLTIGFKENGDTLVYVAIDNKLIGIVGLSDTIKDESKMVVEKIQSMGIKVYMVTGDNERAAHHVATQIGIPKEHVFAGVLPSGKVDKVRLLQDQKEIVVMIGDGINDSPSLTQADIGISVGDGTDIAMECADIVLFKNDLKGIVTTLDISKRTFNRIILNFIWACVYNILAVPFAGGLFWLITKYMLPPWVAGIAMVFSSISVLISSLLLKWYTKPSF